MKLKFNGSCLVVESGERVSCYPLVNILWMEIEDKCVKLHITERVQPRLLCFDSAEEAAEAFASITERLAREFSL